MYRCTICLLNGSNTTFFDRDMAEPRYFQSTNSGATYKMTTRFPNNGRSRFWAWLLNFMDFGDMKRATVCQILTFGRREWQLSPPRFRHHLCLFGSNPPPFDSLYHGCTILNAYSPFVLASYVFTASFLLVDRSQISSEVDASFTFVSPTRLAASPFLLSAACLDWFSLKGQNAY